LKKKTSIYLGIDFGTTYTCIAYDNNSNIKNLINEDGYYTTPSAIFFDPYSENILFGQSTLNLNIVITNWKRIIGKTFSEITQNEFDFFKSKNINIVDIDNIPHFKIFYNNQTVYYNTLDLTILYLKYIHSLISNTLGKYDFYYTVITTPAFFSSNAREELQLAYEKTGFKVLKVINEPTAASLGYDDNNGKVLVFDCGGGTTDISLINIDSDIFEVLDVIGDNFLGGEDINNNILKYLIEKYKLELSEKNFKKMYREAENCKTYLSNINNKEFRFYIDADFQLNTKISQSLFLEINKSFFNKIKDLINHFKYCTNFKILFTGGSSKLFYFQNIFKQIFPNVKILDSLDPDKAVSIGACKYCITLKNNQKEECENENDNDENDILLLDIVPLSLGVETTGGIFETIIPRCSVLPECRTKLFTNNEDGDTIEVNIFQGESRFVKNNYFLNKITIPLDKVYKQGEAKISVEFNIDTSGILTINVTDEINKTCIKVELSKDFLHTKIPDNVEEIVYEYTINKLYENNLANKILDEL
jgi:molecular chaperone DnaK (HSP70)